MQSFIWLHPRERYRFIRSSVKYLCRETRFRHKWRTADHLVALCHEWFTIPEPLQFNTNDLNNALLKDPALKLDMQAEKSAPNQFGINYDTYCPKDTTKRRNHCYYLCDPNGNDHVQSPSLGKAWFATIPDMMDDIRALECATRNKEQRQFPPDVIDLVSIAKNQEAIQCKRQNKEEEVERAAKRLCCQDSNPTTTSSQHTEQVPACCLSNHTSSSSSNRDEQETPTSITIKTEQESDTKPHLPPGCNIWWQSKLAFKLFNASEDKETVLDRVEELIAVLDNANSSSVAFKTIVEGLDSEDDEDTMSEHKKEDIRMKARYLAQAYRVAIEEMPFKKWNDCCRDVIDQLAAVHIKYITNEKVLRRWHVQFCKKKLFSIKRKGNRDLPAFLEAHPIVVTVIKEYGRANLTELSVEMMHSYLHDKIVKSLVMERLWTE
ncbi:hypothetical protein MHU86_18422 [Fragilaria crotonensis]|nr:hypothetical protein MHU86_18422 [Fragilaria crotonensis]